MIAYGYDEKGFYTGEKNCQLDPIESRKAGSEIWLLPANATWEKPLSDKEGFNVKFQDGSWIYEEIPQPEPKPEPTEEEKKQSVRAIRDGYINGIMWRVERYKSQKELGIETNDSDETYIKILQYQQYLRDYPSSSDDWFEKEPLTFDEWFNQ